MRSRNSKRPNVELKKRARWSRVSNLLKALRKVHRIIRNGISHRNLVEF